MSSSIKERAMMFQQMEQQSGKKPLFSGKGINLKSSNFIATPKNGFKDQVLHKKEDKVQVNSILKALESRAEDTPTSNKSHKNGDSKLTPSTLSQEKLQLLEGVFLNGGNKRPSSEQKVKAPRPKSVGFILDEEEPSAYKPSLVRDADKHRISVMQRSRTVRNRPHRPRYCSTKRPKQPRKDSNSGLRTSFSASTTVLQTAGLLGEVTPSGSGQRKRSATVSSLSQNQSQGNILKLLQAGPIKAGPIKSTSSQLSLDGEDSDDNPNPYRESYISVDGASMLALSAFASRKASKTSMISQGSLDAYTSFNPNESTQKQGLLRSKRSDVSTSSLMGTNNKYFSESNRAGDATNVIRNVTVFDETQPIPLQDHPSPSLSQGTSNKRLRKKSASYSDLQQSSSRNEYFNEIGENASPLKKQHSVNLKSQAYKGAWGPGKSFGTKSTSILKVSQTSLDHLSLEKKAGKQMRKKKLSTIPSNRPTISFPINKSKTPGPTIEEKKKRSSLQRGLGLFSPKKNKKKAPPKLLESTPSQFDLFDDKRMHSKKANKHKHRKKPQRNLSKIREGEVLEVTSSKQAESKNTLEVTHPPSFIRQGTLIKGLDGSEGKKKVKMRKKRMQSKERELHSTTLSLSISTSTTVIPAATIANNSSRRASTRLSFVRRNSNSYSLASVSDQPSSPSAHQTAPRRRRGSSSYLPEINPSRPSFEVQLDEHKEDMAESIEILGFQENQKHTNVVEPVLRNSIQFENNDDAANRQKSAISFFKKLSSRKKNEKFSRRSKLLRSSARKDSLDTQLLGNGEEEDDAKKENNLLSSTELEKMPPWKRELYMRKHGMLK